MAPMHVQAWKSKFTLSDSRSRAAPLIASTLLTLCLASGCACLRSADSQADDAEQTAQIERRLHEVLLAAETKDFDRLDSYHLYGPKFTKFTGSSPERLDADATRKGEHVGLRAINGLKTRAEALKIDNFRDVGIATFILDHSFEAGGQTLHRRDRTTLVFVKDNGSWKIVHEHLSPITP